MSDAPENPSNSKFKPQRWHAVFRGESLGWFDTADEAQAAIDLACEEYDAEIA